MQLGMIGLGRMGAGMVRRLLQAGHQCTVHDLDTDKVAALAADGATGARSLDELAEALDQPRAVWLMVPAGSPTEQAVEALSGRLEADDVVIDGGNSHYKDSVRRARRLAGAGIHFVDAGTSGGVWGLEQGYCLMLGGQADVVARLEPVLKSLAPGRGDIPRTPGREEGSRPAEQGYLHCGPAGAGHFVKMVHNGIEYGVMQAYAEGLDLLQSAGAGGEGPGEGLAEDLRYPDLPLADIAEVWRRGSVIRSWLLDLTAAALHQDPRLSGYSGFVQDSGEGRWTVLAAIERAVPADVLSAALYTRFRSRQEHTFAEKVLSAMRHQFGGHQEKQE